VPGKVNSDRLYMVASFSLSDMSILVRHIDVSRER
jgi:hypothetical protein